MEIILKIASKNSSSFNESLMKPKKILVGDIYNWHPNSQQERVSKKIKRF